MEIKMKYALFALGCFFVLPVACSDSTEAREADAYGSPGTSTSKIISCYKYELGVCFDPAPGSDLAAIAAGCRARRMVVIDYEKCPMDNRVGSCVVVGKPSVGMSGTLRSYPPSTTEIAKDSCEQPEVNGVFFPN